MLCQKFSLKIQVSASPDWFQGELQKCPVHWWSGGQALEFISLRSRCNLACVSYLSLSLYKLKGIESVSIGTLKTIFPPDKHTHTDFITDYLRLKCLGRGRKALFF